MSDHVDQLDPAALDEARAWAEEQGFVTKCGDEIVEPRDLSDEEVLRLADRQYPGGSAAFARDAAARSGVLDDGHVSMEPHGQWT